MLAAIEEREVELMSAAEMRRRQVAARRRAVELAESEMMDEIIAKLASIADDPDRSHRESWQIWVDTPCASAPTLRDEVIHKVFFTLWDKGYSILGNANHVEGGSTYFDLCWAE